MPSNPKKPQDRKQPKKTTKKASSDRAVNTSQPIPQAEEPGSKYAPDAWLSGGVGGMEDLVVPTGQTCLVRRPGMEGLMKAGVLHNVDSLSQIVDERHLNKKTQEVNASSLMADPEGMEEVTNVIDRILEHVVVKPSVHRPPNDVTLRKQGVVYTDMIDLVDKIFIFNYAVGGTRNLESFRGGLDEAMGSLEALQGVQPTPQ